MARFILLLLALVVLIVGICFWMGVFTVAPGGNGVQVNPVEVKMESRNVTVPVPNVQAVPANSVQPAQ